ncbi:hypothetical protein [uncultured Thiohalocapsa sp.]|uniref:hypothetical protein n=1 Tax=uncultured Thiohalocapsa sp. TaxID=768990 RepID=UPI0025FE01D7|nr:hypothetical protein [uncultured Thiohalocapsa sp.]
MTTDGRRTARAFALSVYAALCLLVPALMLWVGARSSGIDLGQALSGSVDWEGFRRLLFDDGQRAMDFRRSVGRGVLYATLVAALSTVIAFSFAVWTAHWPRKNGVGLAFVLLTLVLLPQTYLLMPGLVLLHNMPIRLPEWLLICTFLFIGTLPVAAWACYMLATPRIRNMQQLCATDGTILLDCIRRTGRYVSVELVVVFVLAWALAWGNFLVPFSLGSRQSFPAVVQIATFTTNLGRDWAMIAAASFVVSLPGVIAGVIVGLRSISSKA